VHQVWLPSAKQHPVKDSQILFAPKIPVTCANVKIPHYFRRSFEIHIADGPWKSGEILSRAEHDRNAVWAQLQELAPLPGISQFQFISERNSISHLQHWPLGLIEAIPHTFSVTWQIETPTSQKGYSEVVQEGMTPLIDVQDAWKRLYNQVPRLFDEEVIGYRGS
jgi:hypothetical protein